MDSQSSTSSTLAGQRDWPAYAQTPEQVLENFETNAEVGLTAEQVSQRQTQYGSNDLGEEKGVRPLQILIAQVVNAMTMACEPPFSDSTKC